MDINSKNGGDLALQSQPQATVKQEKLEPVESTNENSDLIPDSQSYILQQQQLQYETDFQYKELKESNADSMANVSENSDEPIAKRPRRRRQATKPVPPESLDSSDNDNDAGDSMLEMTVTKTEEESESDGDENVDDPEPAKYGSAGDDTEQPGPSGLGKGGTDAPYLLSCFTPIVTIKEGKRTTAISIRKSQRNIKTIKKDKTYDEADQEKEELLDPTDIKSELIEDERYSNEQRFKCRICKTDNMMDLDEFKLHYKALHKDKRLPRAARTPLVLHSCDICSKNFKSLRNLNEHMETHNNQYDCEDCNESFKKVLHYTLHKRIHSVDDMFRCIFCDFSTENVNDITSHLSMKHETNHRYICKICNKGFDVLTWFKEHDNFHSGVKPFKCSYCGKSFLYSRYLSAHKNSMHKEEITGVSSIHECVICKKQYQHKNSLKLHMNVHTGNFAICDICGKQLSSKEKLKFHLRIHTGYKPFKCSYCEKCFTKKPILVEHERIHTGERPYDCEYCHKAFSQRSSLVIHIRSHTGEKPYVCHVCNKGFVARAMLNIHFKTCKGY